MLASAMLFGGCIKETFPTDAATEPQIKDPQSLVKAMNSQMVAVNAAKLLSNYGVHFDFGIPSVHLALDAMCEDFVFTGGGMDWFRYWGANVALGETYIYCDLAWSNYYPLIKMSNDIIKKLDPASEDPATKAALGMAHTYRAAFYLDLVRMFEFKENKYTDGTKVLGLAVPIVTENTTEQMAANNPRAKVDEVYTFILEDLAKAETYYEGIKRADKSTPDLSVVYGFYARVYLERGIKDPANYAKAAEYARKAIDASGSTPLTQDQWEDPVNGFNNMGISSWMWGLRQSTDNVNNLVNFTAFMANENNWGYGENAQYGANKRLYDRVDKKDFRKHSWMDPQHTKFYAYKTNRKDPGFLDKLNPYANLKFRPAGGNLSNYKLGNATDYPMMRVEEMYLIEAEAAGQASITKGVALLNAFMKYRITDGSYDCTSKISDFRSLQEEIALQKRIEFWGEGITFFDFKRLRLGMTRGYKGTNVPENYRLNADEIAPWWNWVIIRSEQQSNAAVLGHNNPDPTGTIAPWEE
ncbi:MAG: RagB/SusD family nutrient uptake outer membrane protein [Alistipes sp.]